MNVDTEDCIFAVLTCLYARHPASIHIANLPIVLVFGIATSLDTAHQMLSRSAHSTLNTRRFSLQVTLKAVHTIGRCFINTCTRPIQSARKTLERLVDSLLMDTCEPFGLLARPFQVLVHQFSTNHISVAALSSGMQVMSWHGRNGIYTGVSCAHSMAGHAQDAILEHYLMSPVSFLCDVAPNTSALTPYHCTYLRCLPSMRRYNRKKEPVRTRVEGQGFDCLCSCPARPTAVPKQIEIMLDAYTPGTLKSLWKGRQPTRGRPFGCWKTMTSCARM